MDQTIPYRKDFSESLEQYSIRINLHVDLIRRAWRLSGLKHLGFKDQDLVHVADDGLRIAPGLRVPTKEPRL